MKFLLIVLLSGIILPIHAEEYYYFEEQKLTNPPEFCLIEFEDPQLPGAEERLYQITQDAIQEWEDKLIRFTGEKQGWDFTYKTISQKQYDNIFSKDSCDITIYYEREPSTEEEKTTAGHTYVMFGFADITIFYLEPVWIYKGQIEIIEGVEYEVAEISHYKNSLDPFNDETIKHEIGHALGLDHYPAKKSEIKEENGIYTSPSIMTLSDYSYLVDRMEITEYDIRSIVNLYGEDGINELNAWAFLDYALLVVLILVIVYFVRKMFSNKVSKFVSLGTANLETRRCIRCSRLLSNLNESDVCNNCLKKNDFGI